MTPTEAFEAWWNDPEVIRNGITMHHNNELRAWLAACAWQRKVDAEILDAFMLDAMNTTHHVVIPLTPPEEQHES